MPPIASNLLLPQQEPLTPNQANIYNNSIISAYWQRYTALRALSFARSKLFSRTSFQARAVIQSPMLRRALGSTDCSCHLEILHHFLTRWPAFSFCAGPHKLCSQSCPLPLLRRHSKREDAAKEKKCPHKCLNKEILTSQNFSITFPMGELPRAARKSLPKVNCLNHENNFHFQKSLLVVAKRGR